ncbi:hypothetical protein MMC20_007401 [Loxospora ochrophaea]|nr:hypothetical protein [Loxospora ochrophaea]
MLTTTARSSPPAIHGSRNTTDSSRTDLSSQLTAPHSARPINHKTNSTLQPRDLLAVPVVRCPLTHEFDSSFCTALTERSYIVLCKFNEDIITIHEECDADQFCVDGGYFAVNRPSATTPRTQLAFCCNKVEFDELQLSTQRFQSWTSDTSGTTLSDEERALAAVIIGNEPTSRVLAKSLQVEAQTSKEIFDAVSWTTLEGGLSGCTECMRAGIRPLPKGTERIKLNVELEPEFAGGKLYLGLLSLGL